MVTYVAEFSDKRGEGVGEGRGDRGVLCRREQALLTPRRKKMRERKRKKEKN